MSAINFEKVSFQYAKSKPIFENLTASIENNQVTVLLGANGSGKSTFLKLCLGYLKPTKGLIYVCGQSYSELPAAQYGQQFSYSPQTPALPYHLSVRDYILLGRAPHLNRYDAPGQKDLDLSEGILAQLDLEHLAAHSLQEISGGEQQMASFGRILMQNSPIILVDEITSDLDIKNTLKVIHIITSLKKDHTILFSTHDPQLAEALADKVILFNSRKDIQVGNPEELLTKPHLAQLYDIPENHIEKDPIRILWN